MKKTRIVLLAAVAILAFILVSEGDYLWSGDAGPNMESANAKRDSSPASKGRDGGGGGGGGGDTGKGSYLQEERNWVESCCVRSSGAITMAPGGSINPYFANLAAQGLLKEGSRNSKTIVKGYIQWYLNHLNKPDNLGVHGTVYDYKVVSGDEVSKMYYDSSDSYAATFLTLVKEYYGATGDSRFVTRNLDDIKLVAGAIDSTMRPDGLTNAKINYEVAYLMDNVEVWKGYKDFAYLLGQLGDSSAQARALKASTSRSSIESLLWDEADGEYNWFLGGETDFNNFYPDSVANMWPVIFQLPEASGREQALYQKFITSNPDWVTLDADAFLWVSVSLAAVAAGDTATAQQFEANMRAKFMPARAWPWNTNESGWYMKYLSP